jgi:hypothetical protein
VSLQLQEVEAKFAVAGSAGNAVQKISEKSLVYGGAGHTSMSGVNENKKKEEKKEKVEEKNEEKEEEEEQESKIRGYKLTKDGRKTTFFNNELDEKTKALIGSIAPQKIEIPSEGPGSAEVTVGAGTGSAWNSAGTFESVDHCKLSVCTLFVIYLFIYLFIYLYLVFVLFYYLLLFLIFPTVLSLLSWLYF